MSPFEHGEVFVLDDGGECDLDLGNYERFLGIHLTKDHNITTGKVYNQVIRRERRGDYLGKTVQMIPHVTNAIQDWIEKTAFVPVDDSGETPDICLIELGGTVGDIESNVFLEALRQFQFRVGPENIAFVHVSLVPVIGVVGEQKTKPTQHSVKELRSAGISPDILLCRSKQILESDVREKLALFCHVPPKNVLTVHDVPNIYHVPLLLAEQNVQGILLKRLQMEPKNPEPQLDTWERLADRVEKSNKGNDVHIALVGKYTGLSDSYLSVIKSLKHATVACGTNLVIDWIEAAMLEPATKVSDPDAFGASWERLKNADGILVPGGFGDRGVEGKILAAQYARENKVPYLGVCLGMQCAVIEYARNVCGIADAGSAEFNESCKNPVILFMPEVDPSSMGGTMRLGARHTQLVEHEDGPTLAQQMYAYEKVVFERHRHRYEVNTEFKSRLEEAGLKFAGMDDRKQRMEIIELSREDHPFYFATQYHPEFTTKPDKPSPPFLAFILATIKKLDDFLPFTAEPIYNEVSKFGAL
eukprot:TRINITY_DN1080_c0_g1_i4.p1 TRINITY_DN1080_c0_g1~~TRINITY_DN1080_c0_g1_i4.p1  ORF type:complete len:530 (+),score=203.82 TRINITY_DN1080_c0_g1_i4:262-1851(+)